MQTTKTLAAVLYQRALKALETGRAEDAVHALRQIVALDPAHARAWNDLGVLMEALGNHREALRCYQQALRANPKLLEAQSNLSLLSSCLELVRWAKRQPALSF